MALEPHAPDGHAPPLSVAPARAGAGRRDHERHGAGQGAGPLTPAVPIGRSDYQWSMTTDAVMVVFVAAVVIKVVAFMGGGMRGYRCSEIACAGRIGTDVIQLGDAGAAAAHSW